MSGTDTVSITIGANATDFQSACQSAAAQMAAFRDQVTQFANTLTAANGRLTMTTAATQAMRTASTQATAALGASSAAAAQSAAGYQQIIDASTGVGRSFSSAEASAAVFSRALGDTVNPTRALRSAFVETGAAAGHAMHGTAGITRELIVMGHEAVSGRFSRIPGSLMVLGERMGSLSLATIGWAAAIGAAVYAVYELASAWMQTEASVQAAHGAMVSMRTLDASSDAQTRGMIADLRDKWNMGRSAAGEMAQAIGSLGGPAARFKTQIESAAASLQTLRAGEEGIGGKLVTAFDQGTASALRFAVANHLIDENQRESVAEMVAAGDSVGGMSRLLETLAANYGKSGQAAVQAGRDAHQAALTNALNAAALGPDVGAMPGTMEPVKSPLERMPQQAPKAADPAEQDQDALLNRTNAALRERRQLLTELQMAQAAQARGAVGADEAVATIEAKLATVHTVTEQQDHAATLAGLQADLAAAHDNAAQRVAIEQKIAAETARYEGAKSTAAIAANTQVAAAQRAASDQALQLKLAQLSGEEAAAHGSVAAEIAVEDQKLAVLRAAGREGTVEYQSELNRRAALERQAADQATQTKLRTLRAAQEAAQGDLGKQAAIQDQIVAVVREADGAESADLAQAVAKRDQLRQEEARQAAREAIQQLEDKRRLLQENTQPQMRHVQTSVQEGDTSIASARAQQVAILQAYQQGAAAILAEEQQKAAGITALSEQVAQRQAQLAQQTAQQITAINDRAAEQTYRAWEVTTQQVANSFANEAGSVLRGQQTLGNALERIGMRYLEQALAWGLQRVLMWTVGEAQMLMATITGTAARTTAETTGAAATQATTAATAIAGVEAKAADAAAGAYSAMASIPYVGPALGAAAAAATYAAVMAYGVMFSAERGFGTVPFDGAVTALHKNEMVLPSAYADVIRGMAAPGGGMPAFQAPGSAASLAARGAGASAGGGAMHLHYSPTINSAEPRSLSAMLSSESGSMRRWFQNEMRNGTLGR